MIPLAQLIEAALFAADRPLAVEELCLLDSDASLADVRTALDQLREHYDFEGHGVELVELAGGHQIVTRAVHAEALERAQFSQRTPLLSRTGRRAVRLLPVRP